MDIEPGDAIVGIAAGARHTCALLASGAARCWGDNSDGQLDGIPSTTVRGPLPVPGVDGILELSAGAAHTCARLATNDVWCWGSNMAGQLGDGGSTTGSAPRAVGGL